ncbi:hypothetical protein ONS95_001606 [Cadophora gregata]|uniref:uncharacterized protein n=1 Tax=Cadophora gregata TaxID=51156 RepID=UPI0026DBBFA7|nr:uncharacterized protein ONS95_001606 [Cadophora gregata]KAK0111231.1 hypothetical protein ONS95_001606 [Cadophora gregata]KAK0112298.1 hypothetical protein ONS96_001545 [Cadophora gregata f. sp. sojae]
MTNHIESPTKATLGLNYALVLSQFEALSMQRPPPNPTNGASIDNTSSRVRVIKRARQPSSEASESPQIKRSKVQHQPTGVAYGSKMDIDLPISQSGDPNSLVRQDSTQKSPYDTISPRLVFDSQLPRELRDEIHAHALALRPGICPPALREVAPMETRKELLEVYRSVNYVVRESNYPTFRRIPMGILKRVRHLTLVYEQSDSVIQFFSSDKTKLINYFTTLTIDVTKNVFNGDCRKSWDSLVRYLVVASKEGVEKITFVFAAQYSHERARVTDAICKLLGFPPKQIDDDVSGRNLHVLVWEASKGYMKLRTAR